MAFTKDSARLAGAKSSRKGIPNKATSSIRDSIQSLVDSKFEQYQDELDKLDGKDYVQAYHQLLEYVLPKLQRVESSHNFGELDSLTESQLDQVLISLDLKRNPQLPSWIDEGKLINE